MMKLTDQADAYIRQYLSEYRALITQLCKIPSWTGQESNKANFVKQKLGQAGCRGVQLDEAGNVLYCVNGRKPTVVYVAHIDTVFENLQSIEPKILDGRLFAPSVGDNSAGVAALMTAIFFLEKNGIALSNNTVFAFVTGEEGLGNLKGTRFLLDQLNDPIKGFIAVDGGMGSVVNRAVGSKRYRVQVRCTGGHSFGDFGAVNAIAKAAAIIGDLYDMQVPQEPKTTYNVGLIEGGTSVNTIAENADLVLDFRSVEQTALERLLERFRKVIKTHEDEETDIQTVVVGERPCGEHVNQSHMEQTITKVRRQLGLPIVWKAGSTDCNIPLSRGISALNFGVTDGTGAHTTRESIALDTLDVGLQQLFHFMLMFDMYTAGEAN